MSAPPQEQSIPCGHQITCKVNPTCKRNAQRIIPLIAVKNCYSLRYHSITVPLIDVSSIIANVTKKKKKKKKKEYKMKRKKENSKICIREQRPRSRDVNCSLFWCLSRADHSYIKTGLTEYWDCSGPNLSTMATNGTQGSALKLPRLLCLHGGGCNARIFRSQCRVLHSHLQSEYRLCFVDAPFESEPGPDITLVYKEYGPFRRWLCWKQAQRECSPEEAVWEIDRAIDAAMEEDDRKGATGEWVGILGFSQGAKMAASLLYRQQIQTGNPGTVARTSFQFAVLLAGRGPLVSLVPGLEGYCNENLQDAGGLAEVPCMHEQGPLHPLRLPTIHVHGLMDSGLDLHRHLRETWHAPGTAKLIEWNGGHRVPIQSTVVFEIVREIRRCTR
jgi:pimeloyl-ACP methyl ester carboxylesterase